MCVAVSAVVDVHLISATVFKAETDLFRPRFIIIHSLFGCVFFLQHFAMRDGVTFAFSLSRRNRNFGSNVLLSSTVWIFSCAARFSLMDNLCARQENNEKKFTLDVVSLSKSLWTLESANRRHEPKKNIKKPTFRHRVSLTKSRNSIVFIIPDPANYLEFSSTSPLPNFFPFSCKRNSP